MSPSAPSLTFNRLVVRDSAADLLMNLTQAKLVRMDDVDVASEVELGAMSTVRPPSIHVCRALV